MVQRVQNTSLGALDPDVRVPAAVQRAAAAANAAYGQVENVADQGDGGDDTLKIIDNQPNSSQRQVEVTNFTPDATVQPPQQQRTPVQQPQKQQTKAQSNARDFERELNGAIGREKQAVDALREREKRIMQLEAMIVASAPLPAADPADRKNLITPEERESYGDELLTVAAKAAREQIDPELAQLRREVQQLKNNIGQVGANQQIDAQARMYQDMDVSLPEWRGQNADPAFLSWLGLPDPYSGVIRNQLLARAFQANDAKRVIAFFSGFRQEQATVDPAGSQTHTETGRVPLETFAAPGRAKSAAAPAPAEKASFTTAEIHQFYEDVRAGKYRNNEAARATMERSIFEAQSREGGIRRV